MLRFLIFIFALALVPVAYGRTTDCKNATTFGADPTGVGSSTAAFNQAVAANNVSNICVYFPAGTYRFSLPLQVSLSNANPSASFTLRGDGSETTQFKFDPDTTGIILALNAKWQSFHISALSMLAGNASNRSHGISVVNSAGIINSAPSHITDVTIRGADGYHQKDRWGRGINLDKVSNVNISSTTVAGGPAGHAYASAGTCLAIQGDQTTLPIHINIVSSQFIYCQYGLLFGNYLQGVQITTTNFVGNEYGIYLPSGQLGNDELAISSSQFNNSKFNIYTASLVDGMTISGNVFYGGMVSGAISININKTDQFSIVGNAFINLGSVAPNQNAIVINDYVASSGVITGNVFKNQFVTAIWLTPSSQRVNVQSNSYNGPTNTVINQGRNNVIGGGSP